MLGSHCGSLGMPLIRFSCNLSSSRSEGPTMKLLPTITGLATVALVGCETSGGAEDFGDVPAAAVNACINRADDMWAAARGTSVLNGAVLTDQGNQNGNWALQMGTGTLQSTCTVTPIGGVISIEPGGS